MTVLFELLHNAWCPSYDPDNFPDYKRGDPIRAYGQYAFEEGFKLSVGLLLLSLDYETLSKIQ